MTSISLQQEVIRLEDERMLLLGVTYDTDTPQHLERDEEIGDERQRYDDQILAGLICPW